MLFERAVVGRLRMSEIIREIIVFDGQMIGKSSLVATFIGVFRRRCEIFVLVKVIFFVILFRRKTSPIQ